MLEVEVRSIVNEAVGINCFEFGDPHERGLPPFEAGARVDVMVPEDFVRRYSLCNDPRERLRYVIGARREDGRHCRPRPRTASVVPPPVSCSYPESAVEEMAGDFDVKIASSGMVYTVPRGRSIVDVLRNAGIECNTSCEAGICGTCRTRYLEGTPEHHDFVLSEAERKEYLMICCARANSELLVLDRRALR